MQIIRIKSRGGVSIYYKESLHVQVKSLSNSKEGLLLEMSYNNKKMMVCVIYRSPSQNGYEFDTFLSNFLRLLNDINNGKPSLSVVTLIQDVPHGYLMISILQRGYTCFH